MLSTQPCTVSAVFKLRSVALKLGSPIMPVAPPTRAMGVCPACWKRRKANTGSKCPMCRLSAVGSKPQYKAIFCSFNRASKAARSVVWAIKPRACKSWIMEFMRWIMLQGKWVILP